jgi:hypothetical protein
MRIFAIAAAFAIAAMFAMGPAKADEPIMTDGKCWSNISNGNWAWAGCKPEHKCGHHHKG